MEVKWSDRLEELAEGMFKAWEEQPQGDPFARTCVVVGDLATRDWLKDYFLLKRKSGKRRVLANIDFKPLPEFVNDWLWLATQDDAAGERKPAEHPYSRGVLTWRIERIFAEMDVSSPEDAVFGPLDDYIGKVGTDRRRYALAARIAALFDDYLNLCPEMLTKWESSQDDGVAPEYAWQPALYRRLVAKNGNTYARDYAKAKDPSNTEANAQASRDLGYAEVHLFDCAFATDIQNELLGRIADEIPVVKWNLNFKPEHPSAALEKSPIPQVPVEVHSCYSPRRELEAVRNGIYAFLAEHPEAKPSDVRVLCADWQNYEPLVAAVFGANWAEQSVDEIVSKRTMPVRISGAVSELTPLLQSFGDLLAFAENRFEVNAVFGLLGVPAIRAQFGISDDGVGVLREMVRIANIHWGYDDADVCAVLGLDHDENAAPRVFTWRRGLDRLLVDALMGPRLHEDRLVEVGKLKRLLPCGNVEAERARLVSSLDAFVRKLAELRCNLKESHTATKWCELLQHAVDDFYRIDGDSALELSLIRRSIREVTHAAELSWSVEERGSDLPAIASGIILPAIDRAVSGIHPDTEELGEAVTFAPLTSGAAMTADFVWICGLNDGAFPRGGDRAAFDLLSINKSDDDFSLRERDVYALRKASVSARSKLALSYIGRSVKTNEKIPAAVPLSDLVDEIEASQPRRIAKFEHPLQSYSVRYFYEQQDGKLPVSYSAADRAAAKAIATRSDGTRNGATEMVTPFPFAEQGPTIIEIEDLVSYISWPLSYINRRHFKIYDNEEIAELEDEERLQGCNLEKKDVARIVLGELNVAGELHLGEAYVEQGKSVSGAEVVAMCEQLHKTRDALQEMKMAVEGSEDLSCLNSRLLTVFGELQGQEASLFSVELDVTGHRVVLQGRGSATVTLKNVKDQDVAYSLSFEKNKVWDSNLLARWVRHLAEHAAGMRHASAMFSYEMVENAPAPIQVYRPIDLAAAQQKLISILNIVTQPIEVPKADHDLPNALIEALCFDEWKVQ